MDKGRREMVTASLVLGIGLSGFFDGIMLHQILQWHHLLSLVPGETYQDIRTQIFADGAFHVLMYIVTATGLVLLWRSRHVLGTQAGSGWTVAGGGLLGFGIWNVIDVGLFHWVLGMHRIRINVPDPMAYDVGWLVILGLVPMAAGWWLLRRGPSGGHGVAGGATLAAVALLFAGLGALPQRSSDTAIMLAGPGMTLGDAYTAVLGSDGRVLWADAEAGLVAVKLERGTSDALYRAGALIVTRSPAVAGCATALAI